MLTQRIPKLIETPEEVVAACEVIGRSAAIGVDTEFIRETSFFPKIALIQVATEKEIWLFDPTALTKEELGPLLDILIDPNILKIIHAAVADQECFYWAYGLLATPTLDTSVAAALCGMGDSIGLQKLLREILDVHLGKGRARAKWLQRPLSPELLHYAEQDVAHLVLLGARLKENLERLGRWEWVIEESEVDSRVFDNTPEELADKIARGAHLEKEKPFLVELLRWREGRARDADLPRMWVADNETLIALARVQPKTIEELRTFRGLHPKEIDRSGRRIIDAIEKARTMAIPEVTHRSVRPPKADAHAADFIQTYISYLADRHQIMPRFLVSSNQATRILYHLDAEVEDWIREGLISARAAELIGPELKSLFQGKKALVLKDLRLQVMDLPGN